MNVKESVQFILFSFNPFLHSIKEGLLFVCFSIQICGDIRKQEEDNIFRFYLLSEKLARKGRGN